MGTIEKLIRFLWGSGVVGLGEGACCGCIYWYICGLGAIRDFLYLL
jgi:hypothetical protein